MLIFCRATIKPIMHYDINHWFGNITVKSKAHICGMIKMAGKIMGGPALHSLKVIFEQSISQQAKRILSDSFHAEF